MALAVLVGGGAALAGAVPANAAEAPATAGSINWGIDSTYSGMFTTRTPTAPATFDGAVASWPLASDGGGYDDAAGTGTLHFAGAARFGYMIGAQQVGVSQGNYVYLESPTVTIAGDTATLSGVTAGSSHDLNPELPTAAKAQRTVATIDLAGATKSSTDSTVTWTAAPTAITAEGAQVLAHYDSAGDAAATKRAVGSALDPITITVDRTLATTPTPDPGDGDGDGGTTPTPGTETSTTTVSVGPAAPVTAGTATTVTATVAGASGTPTGTVTFTDTAAGATTPTALGTAPIAADGTATWTGALAAGGHTLGAAYAGDDTFAASSGVLAGRGGAAANYGVVDVTEPTLCTTGAGATTVEGVSATWDWSAYSAEWTKTATGDDVAVDGQDFVFSNGVASVDAGCATISFAGTIRVAAYTAYFPTAGQWIDLVDPTLTIAADGTGAWSAGVRSGVAVDNRDAPVRTVVAEVRGASIPDLTTDGSLTAPLAFTDTTAPGTWDTTETDAWSNAFVMRAPSAIRAFFTATATATKNAEKAPSAVAVTWTAAVTEPGTDPEPGTEPEQGTDPEPGTGEGTTGAGNLAWGFKDSWRGYLASIAKGTTSVSDGATIAGDRFVFPQAEGGDFDPATGTGTIRYSGAVEFVSTAHGFDIALRDPWIVTDALGATRLTAAVSTSDTAGLGSTARITVAELADGTVTPRSAQLLRAAAVQDTWTDVAGTFAQTLGPDGWAQYRGQAIDPVSFGFDAAVADPGSTDPTTPVVTDPSGGGADGTDGAEAVSTQDGAATAAQQQCVANTVSGATLTWGLKESFRSYVTGSIAKGAITPKGVTAADGGWTWSGGSGALNTSSTTGRAAWTGGVEFTGHGGAMDVLLSNPAVRLTGPGSASLIADVSSKPLDGGSPVRLTQAVIATLDLDAGSRSGSTWRNVPATLTTSGASAFAGFYTAGTALDPVSFSLPTGAATACDGSTDPELAFTGADVSGPAGLAAVLLALGIALIAVRRSRARAQAGTETAGVAGA